jgi:tetratricopeptide (TPR) repeat protein
MKRRSNHILAILLTLSFSLAFSQTTFAQSRAKQSAENHYEKGMKAYTLGKFPEAIEEFEKAYELRSEPIFLYNIAQSHRQNNAPQRAIFFYRRYLEADPNVKNRADIEKRIKDMETQLNAQKEKENANLTPAPAPQPNLLPQPTYTTQPIPGEGTGTSQPVTVITQPPSPSPSGNEGRGLRIAGLITGSVGVAAVVTGIILGVHATSLHDEAFKNEYNHDKEESSKSFRTMSWVTIGVGSAAVVTGGVLLILGIRSKNSSSSIGFAPILAPGTGGAALFGQF